MNRHALFRRPRTWHLLGVVGIIIGLGIVAFLTRAQWVPRLVYHRPLRYDVPFHAAIAKADKIVVRGGSGFDCCGKVDESNVLFTVTDVSEVKRVASHLQFEPITTTNSLLETCLCCGGPGIDWYRGTRRIALTAVQHGKRIRWRGFTTARILGVRVGYGDGPLTKDSAQWLVQWLAEHGVPGPKEELEKRQR